jgi:hypothetical protein
MAEGIPLDGTRIVRIGGTVRRPQHDRSAYVHAVLRRLEVQGVRWPPRFLGIDDLGREIVSFIDGENGRSVARWADAQLLALSALVRELHDALSGTDEADGGETVCHHDLSPWNTIVHNGRPIAFIDFDGAEPGLRVDDVGYLLWTFVGFGPGVEAAETARRSRLFCDAYAGDEGPRLHGDLVDGILRQQDKILRMRRWKAEHADDGRARASNARRAEDIAACIAWTRDHRRALIQVLKG